MIYTGNFRERKRRLRRHLFDEQSDERQQTIYIALKRLHDAYWKARPLR